MSRLPTKEEMDAIRPLRPQVDCQPGDVQCPFFMSMSATFKICGKNSKDCPCNGLISTQFMQAPDYRELLIRIVNGWNDEKQKDLKSAITCAAKALGMEITHQ